MGAFQGPREWGRLLTAMVTPFDRANRLNDSELARIAAYLVDAQRNEGLVVSGTTGESPTLSREEKRRALEVTLEAVGDRAAVVFGAGTYDTAESIELTQMAEKTGAHGIMLVNPYYSKPGQRGLEAHFRAIASETSLPVMLYNIAPRSSINLETDTLLRLAQVPNIVAVKEASGNILQISEVCRLAPPGFRIYSGDDLLTLPALSVGAHGVVSVAGHVLGREIRAMLDAWPAEPAQARAIHHRIFPAVAALFSAPNPVPVKHALSQRGFDTQHVRLPLTPLNDEERQVVDAQLPPGNA